MPRNTRRVRPSLAKPAKRLTLTISLLLDSDAGPSPLQTLFRACQSAQEASSMPIDFRISISYRHVQIITFDHSLRR